MQACFYTPKEALDWVESELRARCTENPLDIHISEGKDCKPIHLRGSPDAMMPAIRHAAARYPQIEVEAHPRGVGHFYVLLVCACTPDAWEECPLKCQSFEERPRVIVSG